MTQALQGVEGVIKASTSYKTQISKVKAKGKPCTIEGHDMLLEAISEEGFKGEILEQK